MDHRNQAQNFSRNLIGDLIGDLIGNWLMSNSQKCKIQAMPAFADFELHFGVVFKCFANAKETAAVFFYISGKVEGLGNEFVSELGRVVIRVEIIQNQAAVKSTRAVNGDSVIKNFLIWMSDPSV